MKKLAIIFLVIMSIASVSAFSFEDLFMRELGSFITGKSIDNRDPSVTLSRPVDTQVVNNPVVFKWRYFDAEDDELEYYVVQIDDNSNFFSPRAFQGTGLEHKATLEGGLYYWRVRVVNRFGEHTSETWQFYVDPKVKVCDDGTPYFECSSDKPFYCSAGNLREDCTRCGCSSRGTCQAKGSCLTLECTDGTAFNECGLNKPSYCLNGKLTDVCNLCGCDSGLDCMGDGGCKVSVNIEVETIEEPEEENMSFLGRIALFFRGLFLGR